MAAGAGIAPAFAPSKGAVLRLDDPAFRKAKMADGKMLTAIIHFPFTILIFESVARQGNAPCSTD